MKTKYRYKVFIRSGAGNMIKSAEIHSEINLHGILKEGLSVLSDDNINEGYTIAGIIEKTGWE